MISGIFAGIVAAVLLIAASAADHRNQTSNKEQQ